MSVYIARYVLRNGQRGQFAVIAACSCDAITCALDVFGDSLRTCSARPLCPALPRRPVVLH